MIKQKNKEHLTRPLAHRSSLFIDTIHRLRRNRLAVGGGAIILVFLIMAVFAGQISPYDPLDQDWSSVQHAPSGEHLLGTDELGRDSLSRIIHGSRISMTIGVVSVSIGLLFGVAVGLLAGYSGGILESLLMRAMDIMLAIPYVLLAIAIVAILGPGLWNTMIAIGIVTVPQFARVVRSSVIEIKTSSYVEAARAVGAGNARIMVRHILVNSLSPIIVQSTLTIASAILNAAALGFLGLGAQPPVPEWGAMLSDGRLLLLVSPWIVTFPGIAIMLSVLGFNLLGDGLRDALDPRLHGNR
jgi:peptide/nickel transport system permease protein